jgi:hypothetical protein
MRFVEAGGFRLSTVDSIIVGQRVLPQYVYQFVLPIVGPSHPGNHWESWEVVDAQGNVIPMPVSNRLTVRVNVLSER